MAQAELTLKQHGFGQTRRRDLWWLQPLAVFTGLSIFVVYSTWAAFQGEYYAVGPYLSPMYSPEIFGESSHSWFGPKPAWWPAALPWSPAFLILWAPLGFRLTCYYYRGAYYKAFWANPVACAVGKPRDGYRGENSFPLILHNIHRYFLYVALLFPIFLAYDVWNALWFTDEATGVHVLRPRRRHPGAGDQRGAAERLRLGVPFHAPSRRRHPGPVVGVPGTAEGIQLRQLPESQAHAVGLDEPGVGRIFGPLRAPVRHGDMD